MSKTNIDENLLLALNYVLLDSPKKILELLDFFQTADNFLTNFDKYKDKLKIHPDYQKRFKKLNLEKYLNNGLKTANIKFITFLSPQYPESLKQINDAPPLLFYKGDIDLLQKQILAVVGSRNCSAYGIKVTKYFVESLLPYFVICSGLARGIDTVAHETCLLNNCPTIAVVATGVDTIYPSQNKTLGQKIIEKGLILSEYPIGTEALGYRFPQRNRIISGLAKGVVVTEAAKKSGALITARLGAEQGKEVFAVPGNIFLDETIGTNHLIQDGAKLVNSHKEILSEYFEINNLKENEANKSNLTSYNFEERPDLTEPEKYILKILHANPLTLDELMEKSTYTVSEILENISRLELKNLILEIKPNKYKLT